MEARDTQGQGHCPCGQQVIPFHITCHICVLLISLFRSPHPMLTIRSPFLLLLIGNSYLHEELQVKILSQIHFANVVSWAVKCLYFATKHDDCLLMLPACQVLPSLLLAFVTSHGRWPSKSHSSLTRLKTLGTFVKTQRGYAPVSPALR